MFLLEDKQQINNEVKSILSSAIKQNEKVLYIDYAKQVLVTVCLSENNIAYVRESSIKQTIQISTNFNNFQMCNMQIDYAFLEGGDGFLLFKNPLTIFFITKQNQTPIKLTLNIQLRVKSCLFQLNYPNITIYGARNDSSKSQILQVNLQTLNLKTINDGKGYSPGSRRQSLSILVDGRIYTFGGRDQNGKICDKMIWVYDLEKGYWFALQMEYPSQQDFGCCQKVVLSTSKVLIISKKSRKSWILQIHQSRLTQIQGNLQEKGSIKSIKQQLVSLEDSKLKILKKRLRNKKK